MNEDSPSVLKTELDSQDNEYAEYPDMPEHLNDSVSKFMQEN